MMTPGQTMKINLESGFVELFILFGVVLTLITVGFALNKRENPSPPAMDIESIVKRALKNNMTNTQVETTGDEDGKK